MTPVSDNTRLLGSSVYLRFKVGCSYFVDINPVQCHGRTNFLGEPNYKTFTGEGRNQNRPPEHSASVSAWRPLKQVSISRQLCNLASWPPKSPTISAADLIPKDRLRYVITRAILPACHDTRTPPGTHKYSSGSPKPIRPSCNAWPRPRA